MATRNLIKIIFGAWLLWLPAGALAAQTEVVPLAANTINNSVTALVQDDYGFVWVGTASGLFRFDAYSFKEPSTGGTDGRETLPMLKSYIRVLCKDSAGNIIIGTDQGVAIYYAGTNRFAAVGGDLGNRRVNTFCCVPYKGIVAGSSAGIILIDPATADGRLIAGDEPGLSGAHYIASDTDGAGNVWLGCNDRLVCVSFTPQGVVTRQWMRRQRIDFLKIDPRGRMWFNDGDKVYVTALPRPGEEFAPKLAVDRIEAKTALFIRNEAWFGTAYSGVLHYAFDAQGGMVPLGTLWVNPARHNDLANFTAAIMTTRHDNIWLGTLNGLYMLRPKSDDPFRTISEADGLSHNVVSGVCQDAAGNIWASTSNGLNRIAPSGTDVGTGGVGGFTVKHFGNGVSGDGSVIGNRLQAIAVDGRNMLWIGTKNSILQFDPATGRFFTDPAVERFLARTGGYYVWSLYKDPGDNIFIGLMSGGLEMWDHSTDSLRRIEVAHNGFLASRVGAVCRDSAGDLWFDSKKIGLIRIAQADMGSGVITRYRIYPDTAHRDAPKAMGSVNALALTREGILLAGAVNGLYRYDKPTDSFVRVRLDFLDEDAYVCSITEDDQGYCWVFTSTGVYCYSPSGERLPRYFRLDDGAFARVDYTNGSFLSRQGLIFAGGINGVTCFRPEQVRQDTASMPILVSEFTVLNREVVPDGRHLSSDINHTDHLDFFHNDVQFALTFTTLDFARPQLVRYCYRLDGFDRDWLFVAGGRNFVSYSNLSPGEYTLHVKATGSAGEWADTERTIRITVHAAWWATWWFRLLCALAVAGIVFGVVRMLQLRYKYVQNQKLNDWKQEFFTNVTHGLKAPLTMLQVPLEEMLNPGEAMSEGDRKRLLVMMYKNVRRISGMIRQLMEFRRIEHNKAAMSYVKMDVARFAGQICDSFRPVFDAKGITLEFSADGDATATIDPEKIEIVLFNLLHNAYNFTPQGGSVLLSCSAQNRMLHISVRDNGIGIAPEHQHRIFQRFWQARDEGGLAPVGAGLGLALSKALVELHGGQIGVRSAPGVGSVFTVTLPIERRRFGHQHVAREEEESVVPQFTRNFAQSEFSGPAPAADTPVAADAPCIALLSNETNMVELIRLLLAGYRITEFYNTEAAWKYISTHKPQMVIADTIASNRGEGVELCRRVKQNVDTSHIPFLLLTAEDTREDVVRYYETGVDSILEKPFFAPHLRALVNRLLDSRRMIHERVRMDMIIEKETGTSIASADEKFLSQAMNIIEENLSNEDFLLADFAQRMYMSRSALHNRINAITGRSPMELLRNVRLQKAAGLIASRAFTVMQVSYMTGFSDQRHFSTSFRKHFGMSPREYAARNGSGEEELE